VVEQEQEL
jgi:hypothetical protein